MTRCKIGHKFASSLTHNGTPTYCRPRLYFEPVPRDIIAFDEFDGAPMDYLAGVIAWDRGAPMSASTPSRRYRRIGLPKGIYVAWHSGGERLVSRVSTLGLGGLYINTPKPPSPGEVVRLLFEVPGGEVRALATVRTSEKGKGMGVEFTSMGADARARLNNLLMRLLGTANT